MYMLTLTNLIGSHEFSHAGACMQIHERGGTVPGSGGRAAEIFMPQKSFWYNLRLDARLEAIKWPFF